MRARTVIRGGVLVVLIIVLALLVADTAVSAWGRKRWVESSARFEQETGTLDLRALELPGVPDERNAATWIVKGAAALLLKKGPEHGPTVISISPKDPNEWSDAEVAVFREEVELNRDGLAVLARARAFDDSTFAIPVRDGSTAKIPNLLQIVDASRLVFVRGGLALRDGDREAATSDAGLLGTIARALQHERPLIVVWVGLSIERFQLSLVRSLVQSPALTADELREIVGQVLSNDTRAGYAHAIAAEAAVMCAEFRPLGGGSGPQRQDTISLSLDVAHAIAGDALAASCLDVYRETAASVTAPVLTIAERIEEAKRRLHAAWGSRLASKLIFPNLVNGSERAWLTLELRRLTRAAATLRERAWRDGAYQADLGELPPEAVSDPEGAGAWTYERSADGSARLAAPAAFALAERVLLSGQAKVAPFVWKLPAPTRGR